MKTTTSFLLGAGLLLIVSDGRAEMPAFISIDAGAAYGIGGETGLWVGPAKAGISAMPSASRASARSAGAATVAQSAWSTAGIPTKEAAAPESAATQRSAASATSALGRKVLHRARRIGAQINATGGYRFDGVNDCYGFVRRVWDEILSGMNKPKLPVNDYVSPAWHPIADWSKLKPGDVLATHQGHMWGARWHTGLYVGTIDGRHMIYDNSGHSSRGGAYIREMPAGLFKYYYGRTNELLSAN